ncbi:PaaI family thioesterase [Chitinivorax sp. B]|uniref:PaaI family thioesterase n=1 Tax=Chitinivorax sp. B TaxID=2502235 RepID=UPI0010F6249F|nr:PaaI family thioesterase [Chitinivorax sp. B]
MVITPADPHFEARTRNSFARQQAMHLLGASMTRVAAGEVEIMLPHRPELTQQHGFFHGGIVATIADVAGGCAAFTLFKPDESILTVEFKINLVAPADGERLVAIGTVKKPGRTLTVCEFEVLADKSGQRKPCAYGLQTLMCVRDRPGIAEAD